LTQSFIDITGLFPGQLSFDAISDCYGISPMTSPHKSQNFSTILILTSCPDVKDDNSFMSTLSNTRGKLLYKFCLRNTGQ